MLEADNVKNESDEIKKELANFAYDVLTTPVIPKMPEQYQNIEEIVKLYDYIIAFRNILFAFSQGDLDHKVIIKGAVGGAIKSLQANLKHLNWQVQMVASGDFDQRVDFMGEFSYAFNTMVVQFEQTLNDLKEQKELLKGITDDLHKEIAVRKQTERALKESEERYRSMARMDPLTNLYNRRYFFELAGAEIHRMSRNQAGVCVIAMLDIDYFKKFNDVYGHQCGDECLRNISSLLKKSFRRFDLVARYGGEEFVIMLPQTNYTVGGNVLERIRKTIESSSLDYGEHKNIKITVSIGYTVINSMNAIGGDIDQILAKAINEADVALYNAKNNNRNQVKYYHE